MDIRKTWDNQIISVHWWNMGSKTLDFEGTVGDLLNKKGIKVSSTKTDQPGWKFALSLSSTSIIIRTFSSYEYALLDAIKTFYVILGDKTQIHFLNRDIKINW